MESLRGTSNLEGKRENGLLTQTKPFAPKKLKISCFDTLHRLTIFADLNLYIMQLSEQEIIRREKLKALRDLGINPYPANLYPVTHTSKQVKEQFEEGKKVILAGRIMSDRDMGKVQNWSVVG